MSGLQALLVFVGVWVLSGLLTAWRMSRRGHSAFTWGLLGAVMGPLVLPAALGAVDRERVALPRELARGVAGSGEVDVVVGIDGSPESLAALRSAVSLLGSRLGKLTLATVLEYEAAETVAGAQDERRAAAMLESTASLVPGAEAEQVLLTGRPHEALSRFAVEGGYELIAVGSRGRGLTKAFLGSVARRLAEGTPVPVLVVRTAPPEGHAENGSG